MLSRLMFSRRLLVNELCTKNLSTRWKLATSQINDYENHIWKIKRCYSQQQNVVSSKHKSIQIPKCTLDEFIWKNLEKWPEHTAVICGITDKSYTYNEIYKMSKNFAISLRSNLNLNNGDCIAIMLPNSPEFILALLGGIRAGCVITTMNPNYLSDEILHQLKNSRAKVVITNLSCYEEVKKTVEKLEKNINIILSDLNGEPLPENTVDFNQFAENVFGNEDCLKDAKRAPEDTVFLPFSSGTTGLPKGVELSHRNIISNCSQFLTYDLNTFIPTSASYQDTSICLLPLFHIYGLVITLLSKLSLGVKLVTLPKFLPETFLNAQLKYKGNVLYLIPPLVLFLGSHPKVSIDHLSSIRTIVSGAAPLAASDVNKFLEAAKTNVDFVQGYGLTETSPAVCMQSKGNINYDSVGGPIPNTEIKIVNIEDENDVLGQNQVGEIWMRGPQAMKGYYENIEANEECFRPGSWLRTGDLAYYDENKDFYITGRLKELIKVKGFQVAPAELEGILRSHPSLADAAVIGISHPQYGEIPKAFIVKKEKSSVTAQEIMDFVAAKVSDYKRIRDVMFVGAIPKNAAGKILRREIKNKFT